MSSVLIIFLDGVGIGKPDKDVNPFFRYDFRAFTRIFGSVPSLENQFLSKDGMHIFPSDAVMGVEGLPQSGTGQTSLFCGINAQRILGRHFGPFPHSELIPHLQEKNIFGSVVATGRSACFVNAYPKVFFDYIKSGKKRLSVSTLSCRLSGIKLNKAAELRNGRALGADIDNSRWKEKMGYKLPIISTQLAARRLLRMAYEHDFTMYEYFLSDHMGHGRHAEEFDRIFGTLDSFLCNILTQMDRKRLTLLICSDHGNLEDISVKSHTLNPSLTISAGVNAGMLADSIKTLADIKPSVMRLYG